MSGRRESQRSSKLKHEREEDSDDVIIIDTTPVKRQRKDSKPSATINVPNALLQVYQHILPKSPAGIAFLLSSPFAEALQVPAERVAIAYRITKEEAIEELRRLLAIKAFTVDEDATKISPTPLMDELWHATILDTKLYADLQAALGLVLHHRPSGASEHESEHREKRLTVMKAIYNAFFSAEPLGRAPSPPSPPQLSGRLRNQFSIFVRTPKGATHTFIVTRQTSIDSVRSAVQESEGIPVAAQRVIYDGNRLMGGTLGDYEIEDGDMLYIYPELMGC